MQNKHFIKSMNAKYLILNAKYIVMYILINKTRKTSDKYVGRFPIDILEEQLNKGDQIVMISLYSNTIKVPSYTDQYGVKEWEWEDYPFNKEWFNLI